MIRGDDDLMARRRRTEYQCLPFLPLPPPPPPPPPLLLRAVAMGAAGEHDDGCEPWEAMRAVMVRMHHRLL